MKYILLFLRHLQFSLLYGKFYMVRAKFLSERKKSIQSEIFFRPYKNSRIYGEEGIFNFQLSTYVQRKIILSHSTKFVYNINKGIMQEINRIVNKNSSNLLNKVNKVEEQIPLKKRAVITCEKPDRVTEQKIINYQL
jgi:hypothetical protein